MIPPRKLVTIAAFLSGMYPPIDIHIRDSIQDRHGPEKEDPEAQSDRIGDVPRKAQNDRNAQRDRADATQT